MITRKPCDDTFDRDEKAFRKAAEKLMGSAVVCVRQAGADLARACRLFRDNDISQLGALLTENLRRDETLDNARAACHLFTVSRRGNIRGQDPSPEDLVALAALYLEDSIGHLLSENTSDLPSVGPATVRSRAASDQVLSVLRHHA